MNARTLLELTTVLMVFSLAAPVSADPLAPNTGTDLTAAKIVLASLHRDLAVPQMPNQSPRLISPEIVLDGPKVSEPLLQIAGRCGSSEYYCDSPGFLYCCGNDADGYYCAANVNGCTK